MTEHARRWITRDTFAERSGVSVRTLCRWARVGVGPRPVKVPGSRLVRYLESDVDAWIAAQHEALQHARATG